MTLVQYFDWVAFGVVVLCWIQMIVFSLKSMKFIHHDDHRFSTCIKSFFLCFGAAIVSSIWLTLRYINF